MWQGSIGFTHCKEIGSQPPYSYFADVGKQVCDKSTEAKHEDNKQSSEKQGIRWDISLVRITLNDIKKPFFHYLLIISFISAHVMYYYLFDNNQAQVAQARNMSIGIVA